MGSTSSTAASAHILASSTLLFASDRIMGENQASTSTNRIGVPDTSACQSIKELTLVATISRSNETNGRGRGLTRCVKSVLRRSSQRPAPLCITSGAVAQHHKPRVQRWPVPARHRRYERKAARRRNSAPMGRHSRQHSRCPCYLHHQTRPADEGYLQEGTGFVVVTQPRIELRSSTHKCIAHGSHSHSVTKHGTIEESLWSCDVVFEIQAHRSKCAVWTGDF